MEQRLQSIKREANLAVWAEQVRVLAAGENRHFESSENRHFQFN